MKDPLSGPLSTLPPFWAKDVPVLQTQLLAWHLTHGRHHLPWKTQDPYAIWISEIMLQQTQVATVISKYNQWMARFPTIEELAKAPTDDVLKCWEGLGYYSRARNIHKTAQLLMQSHQGKMPTSRSERLALPGIGPSTASAIGAFAFGQHEAIFDGNVRRVWARWWGDRHPTLQKTYSESEKTKLDWTIAQTATPVTPSEVRHWTQAIMDLGATTCTPKKPKCTECPWQTSCQAHLKHQEEQYPAPKKKIERKQESLDWAWVVNTQGLVAICPPTEQGKWAGLWSLPVLDDPSASLLAQGKHELTHRQILWAVHRAPLQSHQPTWRWVDMKAWDEKAWPRFIRRWWETLSETEKKELFSQTLNEG